MSKPQTIGELYSTLIGWTARHICQDEIACYGKDSLLSQYQFDKIMGFEVNERAAIERRNS